MEWEDLAGHLFIRRTQASISVFFYLNDPSKMVHHSTNPGLYEKLSEEQFYAQKEQYKVQTIAWSNLF